VQTYSYIDKNQYHSTYDQVLIDVLPWDSVYISRVKNLTENLAAKFARDTIVTYLNLVAGQISRRLFGALLTM